ncbi:MAG: hypothetical protein ACKVPJ_13015 [Chitinophagales bacterium]
MNNYEKILSGGDLRSIGKSNSMVLKIHTEKDFDELFQCLYHPDRLVVMRAADIIEKLTLNKPHFLKKHKAAILQLCQEAKNKELLWHLALLIPRLHPDKEDFSIAWNILARWANDKTQSRIVRVNSIQGLFEMQKQEEVSEKKLYSILSDIEKENIPSINARIRKLKMN